MWRSCVPVVLLLVAAGTAPGQATTPEAPTESYPTLETAPGFMYIHASSLLNGSNSLQCIGGGSTIAYNLSSVIAVAADLGACAILEQHNTVLGSPVNGSQFTFLFGPRLTIRNGSPFTPFVEVNAGGDRGSLTCTRDVPCNGAKYTRTVFALAAGGGFDITLSRKLSLRPIQAEYLYTRFGTSCAYAVCGQNRNQNNFRLKSGLVIKWGGSASTAPSP